MVYFTGKVDLGCYLDVRVTLGYLDNPPNRGAVSCLARLDLGLAKVEAEVEHLPLGPFWS